MTSIEKFADCQMVYSASSVTLKFSNVAKNCYIEIFTTEKMISITTDYEYSFPVGNWLAQVVISARMIGNLNTSLHGGLCTPLAHVLARFNSAGTNVGVTFASFNQTGALVEFRGYTSGARTRSVELFAIKPTQEAEGGYIYNVNPAITYNVTDAQLLIDGSTTRPSTLTANTEHEITVIGNKYPEITIDYTNTQEPTITQT